ncbi:glycosyl transferase family 11 [Dysgonomonas alginatilytica]|uniref:Glycosyl transferase family 11 n=1 Tax=Dysgonomonas alginatilytica TaxID=1605892 RepID=A0A2V3PQQ2_9BACT|nr:alpha-1,2-fucosyltransferase [Dysgonomonas alginatilytica]PXV64129.1 glycosyl transferase family 11 [Dysgonomonas alginatilytica]
MVYIELNGRIGNNLFQIAAGASYAKKYNLNYRVVCHDGYFLPEPDNCYIKDYIKQFKDNILRNIPIQEGRPQEECFYYYDIDFVYREIPYHENILLYGTFHSYKYFDKELVNSLFEISPSEKEYILNKYGDILSEDVTSIHVRRGDYCKQPHRYAVASMPYFNKAIDYIGRDKKFLIISDDIEWCKKKFKGDNFYFSDNEKPIIDLYIQMLCKNNIISNSTFSWWGAWLNPNSDKVVIYPDPWYGKTFSNYNTKDLIPLDWIRTESKLSWGLYLLAISLNFKEKVQNLAPKSLKEKVKKFLKR